MIVAGVDDAGRGSVLGPLVIAGVSLDERNVPKLVELGVKDSKLLSPKRRAQLYREIRKFASVVVHEKIEPQSIDETVFNGEKLFRLNYLEARFMARVLFRLKHFDLAFIDCCDTNQSRFGDLVANLLLEQLFFSNNGRGKTKQQSESPFKLGAENPLRAKIRSEHHADRNYPVVSAASIVAKVTRDAAIKRLHKKHGKFGSGYPSDEETVTFLKSFVERAEALPAFTRLSWATVARLYGYGREKMQSRIDDHETPAL